MATAVARRPRSGAALTGRSRKLARSDGQAVGPDGAAGYDRSDDDLLARGLYVDMPQ
jgi:hypothetical protein